jgi:hypothetical protein
VFISRFPITTPNKLFFFFMHDTCHVQLIAFDLIVTFRGEFCSLLQPRITCSLLHLTIKMYSRRAHIFSTCVACNSELASQVPTQRHHQLPDVSYLCMTYVWERRTGYVWQPLAGMATGIPSHHFTCSLCKCLRCQRSPSPVCQRLVQAPNENLECIIFGL